MWELNREKHLYLFLLWCLSICCSKQHFHLGYHFAAQTHLDGHCCLASAPFSRSFSGLFFMFLSSLWMSVFSFIFPQCISWPFPNWTLILLRDPKICNSSQAICIISLSLLMFYNIPQLTVICRFHQHAVYCVLKIINKDEPTEERTLHRHLWNFTRLPPTAWRPLFHFTFGGFGAIFSM